MSYEALSTKVALLEQNHTNLMDRLDEFQADSKLAQTNIMQSQVNFHKETRDTLEKLNTKLDTALEKKADKDQLEKLQGDIRWIVYVVIGSVVTGIIAYFMQK